MATHKVVQVRIRRGDPAAGESQLVYPDRYDPQEVDRYAGLIGPRNGGYSGHIGLGEGEEWCLLVLPNDLADEYAEDPDMEIVSHQKADALRDQWRRMRGEPSEVVDDIDRIQAIRAKQDAGIELSQEDSDALDPDKDVPGVRRRIRPLKDLARGKLD